MPESFTNCLFHCIFPTKDRTRALTDDIRAKLWSYIGGICRRAGMKALAIGGTADHLHMLLSIPSTMPICKAVQIIKASSSKWLRELLPKQRFFEWQRGYGAFSIGVSQIKTASRYIENQSEHHRKVDYRDEFIKILNRHGIDYDKRYLCS